MNQNQKKKKEKKRENVGGNLLTFSVAIAIAFFARCVGGSRVGVCQIAQGATRLRTGKTQQKETKDKKERK
jgi:hypothetical protein